MSLTIEKTPASPLLTKNEIAYQVSTDAYDVEMKIIAHIYIEDTPEIDTWSFVKKLQAYPDPDNSDKAEFYLHDILDAIMTYSDPGFTTKVVDPRVCRRIKIEFFEQLPSDLVLQETLYSETDQLITITALDDDNDYLVIVDGDGIGEFQIGSGTTPPNVTTKRTLTNAYTLGGDFGYQQEKQFNIPAAHPNAIDDVKLPAKQRVRIYQWAKPITVVSAIRYALKGGLDHLLFAELTRDPDYWTDENFDNVIDEDGNLML
jgi:hypothetical protein